MKKYLVLLFMLVCRILFAQSSPTDEKKAVKLFGQAKLAFESKQYDKSLNLLDNILALDSCFLDAYLLKSDIYQELDSTRLQIRSIEGALRFDPENTPKLYYVLANSYYRSGFYQRAYDAYQTAPFAAKARQNAEKCMGAVKLLKHPVPFKSINLGPNINSEDDEYWPSITVDGKTLIFTRLVGSKESTVQRRSLAQEDFYTSQLVDNVWQPSEPLTSINTIYNEGAQTISTDGKLLFFTACTRSDGRGSCDIYFSRNKDGVWSVPQNAGEPVNSPAWESQPSISANGETLYFVSNRQGRERRNGYLEV